MSVDGTGYRRLTIRKSQHTGLLAFARQFRLVAAPLSQVHLLAETVTSDNHSELSSKAQEVFCYELDISRG